MDGNFLHSVKMPDTPQQMSCRGRLIVSHLHQGFSSPWTIIFTGWGSISHFVISNVLVWTWDARKRTSPGACIPTVTCHFSHSGHKSSLKARKSTQSQEHDTAGELFSCLFDLMAYWTLAEQLTGSHLKRYNKSAFAAASLYLHLTEMSSAGRVSNSFYNFVVYSAFILLERKWPRTQGLRDVLSQNERGAKSNDATINCPNCETCHWLLQPMTI